MGETLTQQRRVSDEGLRVVKLCQRERNAVVLIPDKTTESSGFAVKGGDLRAYRDWMSPRTIS